jgi:hypothetical protein
MAGLPAAEISELDFSGIIPSLWITKQVGQSFNLLYFLNLGSLIANGCTCLVTGAHKEGFVRYL